MKTLVIIGAGCSAGLAGLPADTTFLRECQSDIEQAKFLHDAIRKLYGVMMTTFGTSWTGERLETCWNEIDENYNNSKLVMKSSDIDMWFADFVRLAKLESSHEFKYYSEYLYRDQISRTPNEYFFMFAGWELRKIVVKKFSAILSETSRAKYEKLIRKIRGLAEGELIDLISFNYDTLLEQVLENWCYVGFPSVGSIRNNKDKNCVIKPHGSVNWLHTSSEKIEPVHDPIPLDKIGYKNGKLIQHSIIGLVGNKFRHRDDDNVVYITYMKIMDSLEYAVSQAEQIIIIGYSFPLTDGHIKSVFIKGRPQKLKHIHVITKAQNNSELELLTEKISQLFQINRSLVEPYSKGVEQWVGE